ncbi:histidinol dehydrogenase [Patescibacteria group bacterium AH-259-L07]|nr:histidinol dehydrogenase [Patescibacteria group bacterium AH-259-L07]
MKKYYFKQLNNASLQNLCKRKAIRFDDVLPIVENVLREVKTRGDEAIREFTEKFDNASLSSFAVTQKEIERAGECVPKNIQSAFGKAARNIEKFHKAQMVKRKEVKTMAGITCFREARPIEKVGLYIPGGTAPLPSTVLMLAIPAKLAGSRKIVLVTPPSKDRNVADVILFAAKLCGITQIFKIGGAQAIAALAFGTETVPKVYKIFGPGNQYVTAAKMLVSINPEGAAIDIPAGPTEVLVIADEKARADFVASDLLSQAEHGKYSQAIFVSCDKKTDEVLDEVKQQLQTLPRKEIARKSLDNSFVVVVDSIDEAIAFSNMYAPEHLILNVKNATKYVPEVINAGSVFLGPYSCESAGDYASGTNHSLPTYGYARVSGGVSVSSFQKQVTFQKITKQGAKNLGPIVSTLASQESLEGHKKAMQLRYK